MAMIKCKECEKEVSSKAETCPHCGAKVGLSNDEKAHAFGGLFAIAVVTGLWLFFSGDSSKPDPDQIVTAQAGREVRTVPAEGAAWYLGGTLNQGSALDWQSATYANKLATAADFLAALVNDGSLNPAIAATLETVDDFRPWAEELVREMDEALAVHPDPEDNYRIFSDVDVATAAAKIVVARDWMVM